MRVAWLTSGFAPYRVPLWNALGEMADVKVFLLTEQEKIRQWKRSDAKLRVSVSVIPGRHVYIPLLDWGLNLSFSSVQEQLEDFNPDAIIVGGYESPGFWAAALWAKKRNRGCVMHYGSTDLSSRSVGFRPVEFVLRRFIDLMDAYYTYGAFAAKRLVRLGADANRIVVGQNLSDTALAQSCDREGSCHSGINILFVGQLIERKGVMEMVRALCLLEDSEWHCTIVGSGALKPELERIVTNSKVKDRFSILGGRSPAETAALYRQNDVLIMPSKREVWGLTTNEALLSGLFVIGSNQAASCLELLIDGSNGLVVVPSVAGLYDGLRRTLAMTLPSREAIRASAVHITPEAQASKVYAAAALAIDRTKRLSRN